MLKPLVLWAFNVFGVIFTQSVESSQLLRECDNINLEYDHRSFFSIFIHSR